MTERELLDGCLNGSMRHQRQLYQLFAGRMMGLCMRYAGSEAEAEDILQEAFVNVFRKLETYKGTGELGAWIRKIVLNAALMNYRRNKKHMMQMEISEVGYRLDSGADTFSDMSAADLMALIQRLPTGCRIIFNLYAVEGYNHREIAEQLGISSGTSKSQYSRARALLRDMIANEERRVRGHAI